jgi:hypothetical protein
VWVLNNGSISEFNEANGLFIRQIKLGFSATLTPEGRALCGPHLWIVHHNKVAERDALNGSFAARSDNSFGVV